MANTATANPGGKTVFGNMITECGVLTMTDGPGGVALGMGQVYGGSVTPKTVVTGGFNVVFNTASGNVHIYSCASADTFNYVVHGR